MTLFQNIFRQYSETFSDVIRAHTKTQGLYLRIGHDMALDVIRVLHLDDIPVLHSDVTPLFRRYYRVFGRYSSSFQFRCLLPPTWWYTWHLIHDEDPWYMKAENSLDVIPLDVSAGGPLDVFSFLDVIPALWSRVMLISNLNTLNFRRYSETFSVVICAHTKTQGLYIGNGHDLALDVIPVLHHRYCGYFQQLFNPNTRHYGLFTFIIHRF